jgi:fucose permease
MKYYLISMLTAVALLTGCTSAEQKNVIDQDDVIARLSLEDKAHFVIGTGMGPVYPAIQHMAPENFGRRFSAAAIGLQMASAYVGSTLMPMVFGHLQLAAGIRIMPFYLLLFAALNIGMLEMTYRKLK